MSAQVVIILIEYLGLSKLAEFWFLDSSILIPQQLPSTIDSSHDIEIASRILSSPIEFLSVFAVPLIAVALAVTCPCLPELHLSSPIYIGHNFMLGEVLSCCYSRNMFESVLSEEIIPEDEDWCSCGVTFEVVVPSLEDGYELVALFADGLIREE